MTLVYLGCCGALETMVLGTQSWPGPCLLLTVMRKLISGFCTCLRSPKEVWGKAQTEAIAHPMLSSQVQQISAQFSAKNLSRESVFRAARLAPSQIEPGPPTHTAQRVHCSCSRAEWWFALRQLIPLDSYDPLGVPHSVRCSANCLGPPVSWGHVPGLGELQRAPHLPSSRPRGFRLETFHCAPSSCPLPPWGRHLQLSVSRQMATNVTALCGIFLDFPGQTPASLILAAKNLPAIITVFIIPCDYLSKYLFPLLEMELSKDQDWALLTQNPAPMPVDATHKYLLRQKTLE